MSQQSVQVFDEYGRPVLGAEVFVTEVDTGNLAALTSPGGGALAQPVITDEFGTLTYEATDGIYNHEIRYRGATRYREKNVLVGPIGATLSVRLPNEAVRANKFLSFDALGRPSVASGTGTDQALRTDLASDTGASLIKHKPSAAAARTLADRLSDRVSLKDHGGVGNGVVDDAPALQSLVNSLGARGGVVFIPPGMRVRIASNVTIPKNVCLIGSHAAPGTPGNNDVYPYVQVGALLLTSTASLLLQSGAGLRGLLIHRDGMLFPATNASAFAGIAVIGQGDDYFVQDCQIIGFGTAIYSTDCQRPVVDNVKIDCLTGVHIVNAVDVAYLDRVHCWPFSTVAGTADADHRSGAGIFIQGSDWPELSNCFTFGYSRGFQFVDTDDLSMVNCSADGTTLLTGSIGVSIQGASLRPKLTNVQVSSHATGLVVNTTAGDLYNALLVNCRFSTASAEAVRIMSGGARFVNFQLEAAPVGLRCDSAASIVGLESGVISTTQPFNLTVATSNVMIGDAVHIPGWNGNVANLTLKTLASASEIVPPTTASLFTISGTQAISTIKNGWAGRRLTLVFEAAATVSHSLGLTNGIRLSNGANFVATSGAVLNLIFNGAQWFEQGRAA